MAYRKTPTARNLTDLACLLLATNVLPRPGSRYRTSRLKVLVKYYSALLVRCIGFRQHANLLVFYPMLFSCQTSSLAVPQDRTTLGGQAAFTKLLKTRGHSRDFQFQADCFACSL